MRAGVEIEKLLVRQAPGMRSAAPLLVNLRVTVTAPLVIAIVRCGIDPLVLRMIDVRQGNQLDREWGRIKIGPHDEVPRLRRSEANRTLLRVALPCPGLEIPVPHGYTARLGKLKTSIATGDYEC